MFPGRLENIKVLEILQSAIIAKYIEGSGYHILLLVVQMYNRLLVMLEDVACGHRQSITHPLIVKGANKIFGNTPSGSG